MKIAVEEYLNMNEVIIVFTWLIYAIGYIYERSMSLQIGPVIPALSLALGDIGEVSYPQPGWRVGRL